MFTVFSNPNLFYQFLYMYFTWFVYIVPGSIFWYLFALPITASLRWYGTDSWLWNTGTRVLCRVNNADDVLATKVSGHQQPWYYSSSVICNIPVYKGGQGQWRQRNTKLSNWLNFTYLHRRVSVCFLFIHKLEADTRRNWILVVDPFCMCARINLLNSTYTCMWIMAHRVI